MNIKQILSQYYGLQNALVTEVPPGWAALAYRIEASGLRYFLKAYDKTRHSAQLWIQGIDNYMPALIWLGEHTPLQGQVPSVVTTANGSYKCEDEKHLYILFNWIDGTTPRDEPLTLPQLTKLSQIIAQLHAFHLEAPALSKIEKEHYDIHFYESLMTRAQNHIESLPQEYLSLIIEKLQELAEVSKELTKQNLPFVLCHNDIHGGNMITQGNHLVLLDWEGLKFAPAESDLFMFKYERYLKMRWDEFYEIYRNAHPNLEISETAMRFFQLRRRLWDIDEFVDNITMDNASAETQKTAKQFLLQECSLLKKGH